MHQASLFLQQIILIISIKYNKKIKKIFQQSLYSIVYKSSILSQKMVQIRGSLVTQWVNNYPGVPFPLPSTNPQMFPTDFVIKQTTYNYDYSWWDQIWGDCCSYSRCCYKGLIDYQCQFANSCYLNLIQLVIYVIGFLLATIILLVAVGFLSRLAYKFIVSAAFITKFVKFFSGLLKCFTLGIFDQKVFYKHQRPKAEYTLEQRIILQKTEQLDIKIVIPRLDAYQKKRILQVFQDYEIIDDSQMCLSGKSNKQQQKVNHDKK